MILKPKTNQTWGECLFEQMAAMNNLTVRKIKESSEKSVDYEVAINGVDILFEISDFTNGSNEYGSKNRHSLGGKVISRTIGKRMKQKVADKRKQVSKYVSEVQKPCILLVYSQDGFNDNTNEDIISSILGNRYITFSKNTGNAIDQGFDGKSILKSDRNTSFSAIGNIYTPSSEKICSDIYINPWAKYPLPENAFTNCNTMHLTKIETSA